MTLDTISKTIKLSQLKNWEDNPRALDKSDFARLKKQITKFGTYKPLIACKNGDGRYEVIGGNMRLMALKELGHKEAWVSIVNPKTKAEKIEIALSDNDRAGYYDEDKLAELIYEFKDVIELKNYCVDLGKTTSIDDLLSNYAPDNEKDDVVPEPRKTKIKLGDMFKLGEHRLLCGDATKKEDVERLMGGEKADMVFTDPPYGMSLNVEQWNTPATKGQWVSNKKNYQPVIGDDKQFDPSHIFEHFNCKEIILWGGDYYSEFLPKGGSWFVWDKRAGGLEDVKWSTSEFELCWSKEKHHRQIARFRWMGVHGMERQDTDKRIHPTQKPVELCEWFIKQFCKRDSIVVDIYGGSGSTLIACEKLNRKCRMMEIDPVYVQVIIDRWQGFTQKQAEKI